MKTRSQTVKEKTAKSISVISYNVTNEFILSNEKDSNNYKGDEQYLDSEVRIVILTNNIINAIDSDMDHLPIFCLQEVTLNWSNELFTIFRELGYTYIFHPYDEAFGNSGIVIAIPDRQCRGDGHVVSSERLTKQGFDILDINIVSMLDLFSQHDYGSESDSDDEDNYFAYGFELLEKIILDQLDDLEEERIVSLKDLISEEVNNFMISVKLEQGNKRFVISNILNEGSDKKVTMIKTLLATKRVQEMASVNNDNLPYIMCGDFGFKALDEIYEYVQSPICSMKTKCNNYCRNFFKEDIDIDVKLDSRVRSSYNEYHGEEPDSVTHYQIIDEKEIKNNTNFIFISPDIEVTESETIDRSEGSCLPNSKESSVSLMLKSVVTL